MLFRSHIPLDPLPHLSISKTPPASLAAGGSGSWTVTLANDGTAATSGTVTFTDTLPSGLTYSSQTAGSPSLSCSASGQTVTCTGTPNIAANGTLTVTYTTSVSNSASGTLTNAVLLTALGGDPRTPANDAGSPSAGASTQGSDKLSAKAAQSVTTSVLSVSKALTGVSRGGSALGSLSGYQVQSGDVLTYTVSVQETSGNAAGTTTLTETAPSNTSYTGSSEGWTQSGSNYTQSVTVSANTTVTKTFTVTVSTLTDSVASIVNSVTTSNGTCSSCTVTTATVPRLSISKTPPDRKSTRLNSSH